MRLTLRELRSIIKEGIGHGGRSKAQAFDGKTSPDYSDREALGSLVDLDVDTELDDDLSPHLRGTLYQDTSDEQMFGPVPPDADNPYVQPDPYALDVGPMPGIGSGRA